MSSWGRNSADSPILADYGITLSTEPQRPGANHNATVSAGRDSAVSQSENPSVQGCKKAAKIKPEAWQQNRSRIIQLYRKERQNLSKVIHLMKEERNFEASEGQYRRKLKEWKVFKYFKSKEMRAIAKKRQYRKIVEPYKRPQSYRVKGRSVQERQIDNWMTRNKIKFTPADLQAAGSPTPSTVSCRTFSQSSSPDRTLAMDSGSNVSSSQPVHPNHAGQESTRHDDLPSWSAANPFQPLPPNRVPEFPQPFHGFRSSASGPVMSANMSSLGPYYALDVDQSTDAQNCQATPTQSLTAMDSVYPTQQPYLMQSANFDVAGDTMGAMHHDEQYIYLQENFWGGL